MIRKVLICTAAFAIGVWAQTRPRDPFIFRTALRSAGTGGNPAICESSAECRNRLMAVLLDPQMTALYSTETGSLYLTRNALPQDGNLTYSHTQFGNRLAWQTGGAAGATTVSILETPEYAAVGGKPGLRRTIAVTGLAAGQSVRVRLSGSVKPETWTADSGGTLEGSNPIYFSIPADGTAIVTGSWQP